MFSDRDIAGSRGLVVSTVACLLLAVGLSVAPVAGALFGAGDAYSYVLTNTVLLDESRNEYDRGRPVGHRITAGIRVNVVWHHPEHGKLVRVRASSSRLQTRPKSKATAKGGEEYVDRSNSKLGDFNNNPFLVHWKDGRVQSVYVTKDTRTEENFKKGIANLLQFQLSNVDILEDSTLGRCNVTYSKIADNAVLKQIKDCTPPKDLNYVKHPDKILRGVLRSKREGLVKFNDETLTEVTMEEDHEFFTELLRETGASVISKQVLKLTGNESKEKAVMAETLSQAVGEQEKKLKLKFNKQSLSINHEVKNCKHYKSCNKLEDTVKKHHDALVDTELGMSKSAYASIEVIDAIRNSKADAIVKVLKDEQNEDIEIQLYDLLGSALTEDSHKAAMETLDFSENSDFDKTERYLWSASVKFKPNFEVIQSLIKLSEKKLANEKLDDTVFNTITAMTSRLVRYDASEKHLKLFDEILLKTLEKLNGCNKGDDDECRLVYIRALANLRHPKSIDVLLDIAQNGNRKPSTIAMKTVKILGPSFWDHRVLKACDKIFFQLVRERDSSARMIALSILLEMGPDYELLKHVLKWLLTPKEGFENKQYALQQLNELANHDRGAAKLLREVLIREKLNHYGVLAQRGLSSSFSRYFLDYNNITGLVKSSQHIYTGVTKRGSVDIIVEHDGHQYHLCNLGMFTTGLGYFTSLYDDSPNPRETTDEDNLSATAGLEITIFGVHIRPFLMFTSQGQLMGHVWAGTGSERTSVIQGIFQLMEHQEYLPLSTGTMAELSLKGTLSLDIAGQMQMSLWNKNAQSLIEQNGGIGIRGALKLDTDVVTTGVDFSLMTEGLLHTYSDAEFANKIALCMQIVLVDSNMTTITSKNEIVHGYPEQVRRIKTRTHPVAGRTFALNKLVNEFCNDIHSR
ncbi:microsomal triacylglycerol transfer protein [Adelges cooleyi]|uniref:microsomal triacylglycerol transfer protein n=1 Tax=Adelges cooleyi TaxID=133065 RepID=UPI0021807AA0|nr:microsomal triacylglycerol transfer protein [Adelges cooleyi]